LDTGKFLLQRLVVLDADVASDAKIAAFSDVHSIISGFSRGWAIANMQMADNGVMSIYENSEGKRQNAPSRQQYVFSLFQQYLPTGQQA